MQTSNSDLLLLKKYFRDHKKMIIWGLRKSYDSFSFINSHFYHTLKKLNIPAVWMEDTQESNAVVEKGDLVFAVNIAGKHLKLQNGVRFCLHNFDRSFYEKLDRKNLLVLQVYTNDAEKGTEKWDPVTRFDRNNQVLYQPWGTNLLPWEFMPPVYSKFSPFVFWVGSIWDDEKHQGNLEVINSLKTSLEKHKIRFVHARVPDFANVQLMRLSRIAPAFAGLWQAKVNYLPCRVFKNISYGQLGITNVLRFKDLLGGSFVGGESVEEIVDRALSFSKKEYTSLVKDQQAAIQKHTYLNKLLNIAIGFDEISKH